jgi:hypothetical protein
MMALPTKKMRGVGERTRRDLLAQRDVFETVRHRMCGARMATDIHQGYRSLGLTALVWR